MKAILVDDEPLARAHLKRLLQIHGIEVVGEGRTGLDGLNLCENLRPEIAFLDIQMPDLNGMAMAAALSKMDFSPLVVFVTGFSEHAPKAFEYAAFDYLLKPVEPERLALTLGRAERRLVLPAVAAPEEVRPQDLPALKRLPVRTNYSIKLIKVDEVLSAIARDKKVYLRFGNQELKTYYSLNQLESLLPKCEFMRIHASAIVRVDAIEAVNFLGNHSYSVSLQDGSVLPVSRSLYGDLQVRLGM